MPAIMCNFARLAATALVLMIVPGALADAQATEPARVGILRITAPPAANLDAFRAGMREHGHAEGKSWVLVPGWGRRGETNQMLAERLIARGVDVIVTVGSPAGRAANQATKTIPIVMASSADPVGAGLVRSLAAPGGNVTGMSSFNIEVTTKGMQLLKEMLPGLRRVGTLRLSGESPLDSAYEAANARAASGLDIDIVQIRTGQARDFESLFAKAVRDGVHAIVVRSYPRFSVPERRRLVEAALRAKLPNMHPTKEMVKLGGLVSLGTSRPWLYRRAAAYVDKILKGAKPADLPVEQPTKFELAINLKTAKAMGVTIPRALLLRADEVIE